MAVIPFHAGVDYTVNTVIDELVKKLKTKQEPYYLVVIENGIFSIKDKCEQTEKNAGILEEKITTHVSNRGLPKHRIFRGIATWGLEGGLEKQMKNHEINFTIHMTSVPKLTKRLKKRVEHKINNCCAKDHHLIDGERFKEIIMGNDYGRLYKILARGRFYQKNSSNYFPGDMRGAVAELILQEYIIQKITDKCALTPTFNLKFKPQTLVMNGKDVSFGIGSEIDVVLAYTNKHAMSGFLNKLTRARHSNIIYGKNLNYGKIH